MSIIKKGLIALLAGGVLLSSCSKNDDDDNNNNNNGGNATVKMHLTDGPAEYDAVYLDIQRVEVTMEGRSAVELNVARPGVYEILQFRNGLDTFLAQTSLPPGKINQIRLILGNNNSVVVDGDVEPLTTPSGQTSGVKLNLNQTLEANGAYDIWIDFDAAKSIHRTGNGKYMLKPVIRAYSALTDGRIVGNVLPLAALTTVYAINGTDTFAAIPNLSGYYRFSGLPQGTYRVWFDAEGPGYNDKFMTDINVEFGKEQNLGTIVLEL